jgi:hypothetical protein
MKDNKIMKIIVCRGKKCKHWLSKLDDNCIKTCDKNIDGYEPNEFNTRPA